MILVVNVIQPLQTILLKCCINPAFWKAGKVSHLGDFCLCLLCFIHYLSGSVFEHCSNAFYSSPRDAIARNALFRQRCNNFFIDVVTTMCFKDNEPPEAEVIQELLNLLFVHRSLLTGSGELPSSWCSALWSWFSCHFLSPAKLVFFLSPQITLLSTQNFCPHLMMKWMKFPSSAQ